MPSDQTPQPPTDLRKFSHDMRNKLSAIYNYAQVLEHTLSDPALKAERESVRGIMESVQEMNALLIKAIDREDTTP